MTFLLVGLSGHWLVPSRYPVKSRSRCPGSIRMGSVTELFGFPEKNLNLYWPGGRTKSNCPCFEAFRQSVCTRQYTHTFRLFGDSCRLRAVAALTRPCTRQPGCSVSVTSFPRSSRDSSCSPAKKCPVSIAMSGAFCLGGGTDQNKSPSSKVTFPYLSDFTLTALVLPPSRRNHVAGFLVVSEKSTDVPTRAPATG